MVHDVVDVDALEDRIRDRLLICRAGGALKKPAQNGQVNAAQDRPGEERLRKTGQDEEDTERVTDVHRDLGGPATALRDSPENRPEDSSSVEWEGRDKVEEREDQIDPGEVADHGADLQRQ